MSPTKELEQAILDHEMEGFQSKIRLRLDSFGKHKEQLLSLLRKAHQSGSEAQLFDEKQSWRRIETTAYKYFSQEILTYNVWSNADHRARYRAIAGALERARNKIEELKYPDLSGPLIRGCLERTQEVANATEDFASLLYLECELEKLTETLSRLEMMANQVAEAARKGRGQPKGGGALPWNYIYELADDYRKSTGLKPGRGRRPFSRFVNAFFEALGVIDIPNATLIGAIKDTHSYSLQKFEGRPSPFD